MKLLTTMTKMAVFAAGLGFAGSSFAAEPMDLDSLLKTLEQGKAQQSAENKQREQAFMARQNEQVQMLKDTQAKRNAMLNESERLETQFEENEVKLANLTETLYPAQSFRVVIQTILFQYHRLKQASTLTPFFEQAHP